jgi:MFS family permease
VRVIGQHDRSEQHNAAERLTRPSLGGTHMATLTPQAQALRSSQRLRAVFASTIGTSIEWYDFFLYGTAAALVFPKLFFPSSSPYTGILLSYGTQFVGFAARPIGAAIFGHFGDRIGRKATLIVTLMLMGVGTFLIGLLPSHASIGLAAPILLTVLRLIQGIGVGGEWGGSVLISMEWGSVKHRGFMASWPQLGVPLGLLASTGMVKLMTKTTGASFDTWGWRIPFLFSGVLVGVGLYIRLRVLESPDFVAAKKKEVVYKLPVWEVIKTQPREILTSAFVRMSEQAPFYLFITFVLTYGTTKAGFTKDQLLNDTLVAAAVGLVSVPFFGFLSDVIGRRLMYGLGIVATALFAFPYFGLLNTQHAGMALLAIVVSLIAHDMQYGPQAALIAENFGTNLRYSGAGLGYQLASVIAGGPAPLIAAHILEQTNSSVGISWYIIGCCVLSMTALILMPRKATPDVDPPIVLTAEEEAAVAYPEDSEALQTPTSGTVR